MKKTQKASDLSEEFIRSLLSTYGELAGENRRSLLTRCPLCGRSDKFFVLKANGSSVCFHGSCTYGRRWMPDWIALTANIPLAEARSVVYGNKEVSLDNPLILHFIDEDDTTVAPENYIESIEWPEAGLFSLDHPIAEDAVLYLASRNVSLDLAINHGFMFNMITRRLIMPIFIDEVCYGWQGRAIDKVDQKDRMRNNIGFRRDSLVMFYDTIKDSPFFVVAEGPFDALKFNKCHHYVATMGKTLSEKQIKLLIDTSASSVFLGLDDDAYQETDSLARSLYSAGKKVYLMEVPESAKNRCHGMSKKADFGECTEDECVVAMKEAKLYSGMELIFHLKG